MNPKNICAAVAVCASLTADMASARDNTVLTPEQAANQAMRNLQAAELGLLGMNARFYVIRPTERRKLDIENSEWREGVDKGCEPEAYGQAADARGAALEYAQQTQRKADATLDRTKQLRKVLKL